MPRRVRILGQQRNWRRRRDGKEAMEEIKAVKKSIGPVRPIMRDHASVPVMMYSCNAFCVFGICAPLASLLFMFISAWSSGACC
jgi:hypothetical protein